MRRIMHLLNSFGHVTIHWEEQNDEKILPAIQSMLDRGYKFFIIADDRSEHIVTVAEVALTRRVSLSDEMLQQLSDAGLLQIGGITLDDDGATTGEVADTVEAVIANETVVVQPANGG